MIKRSKAMSVVAFLLLVSVISMVICYAIAKRKGVKTSFWVLMAAVFGPLAIPFVLYASSSAS